MTKLDDPIRHAIIGEGDPSNVRYNDTSSSFPICPNVEQTNLDQSSRRDISEKHLNIKKDFIRTMYD